ncbi:MAG: paraquat-inducible protein A, partial [Planctomycetota bacterium]
MPTAHTCTSCGLVQTLPGTLWPAGRNVPGVRCGRCDFVMRPRSAAGPGEAMCWTLALLGLFTVLTQEMFVSFTFAGGTNRTVVTTGPLEVIRLGSTFVGVSVLFCALISPVIWGLGMLYALAGLASGRPGPGTPAVLRVMQKLRPWVMLEVFLLGIIVTHGKLGHDGAVAFGPGFYLYLAAIGVWLIIAFRVRYSALWERLMPAGELDDAGPRDGDPSALGEVDTRQLIGCETCGLVQRVPRVHRACAMSCVRCHGTLD